MEEARAFGKAGREVSCPACGERLVVPAAEPAEPPVGEQAAVPEAPPPIFGRLLVDVMLAALVRDGGRYVIAGHYTNAGTSAVNAHEHINRKHLEIRGCWGSEPGHFLRALGFLERYAATVPWRDIGGRTYPLTQLNDALADAEAMRLTKALVDPWAA